MTGRPVEPAPEGDRAGDRPGDRGDGPGAQQVIEADLTLTPVGSDGAGGAHGAQGAEARGAASVPEGGRGASTWRRGVKVAVSAEGRITAVGALPEPTTLRLEGRALVPGMVNAHSHAFQRGLRGLGEHFPQGAGSFWSWREAMYGLVESLDRDRVYALSRQAFSEMRDAGITSVGEFHYLHHDRYDDTSGDYALDQVVLRAAADAEVRLVLLNAFYRTGGIGRPLEGGQLRFRTATTGEYWAQMDRLGELLDPQLQGLGVVAHSVRAASPDEMAALHQEAVSRGLVFHMHLEEQPAEIEAAREHYGRTPMALVNECLAVDGATTMVHCTHTARDDMAAYLDRGGNVCICPLTEANLGDGLADVPFILDNGGFISLGTDSNARISLLEEMRLLEYGQRLAGQLRGVCRNDEGHVAPVLWDCGTRSGARSLGLEAGVIEAGALADFAVVDLGHPALGGAGEESLLAALILGAPDDVISGTAVGGRWRWRLDEPEPPGPPETRR